MIQSPIICPKCGGYYNPNFILTTEGYSCICGIESTTFSPLLKETTESAEPDAVDAVELLEWILKNAYTDYDRGWWHLHGGMSGHSYTSKCIVKLFLQSKINGNEASNG